MAEGGREREVAEARAASVTADDRTPVVVTAAPNDAEARAANEQLDLGNPISEEEEPWIARAHAAMEVAGRARAEAEAAKAEAAVAQAELNAVRAETAVAAMRAREELASAYAHAQASKADAEAEAARLKAETAHARADAGAKAQVELGAMRVEAEAIASASTNAGESVCAMASESAPRDLLGSAEKPSATTSSANRVADGRRVALERIRAYRSKQNSMELGAQDSSAQQLQKKHSSVGRGSLIDRVGMKEALPCTPTSEMRSEVQKSGDFPLDQQMLQEISTNLNAWLEDYRRMNGRAHSKTWFNLFRELDLDG